MLRASHRTEPKEDVPVPQRRAQDAQARIPVGS